MKSGFLILMLLAAMAAAFAQSDDNPGTAEANPSTTLTASNDMAQPAACPPAGRAQTELAATVPSQESPAAGETCTSYPEYQCMISDPSAAAAPSRHATTHRNSTTAPYSLLLRGY